MVTKDEVLMLLIIKEDSRRKGQRRRLTCPRSSVTIVTRWNTIRVTALTNLGARKEIETMLKWLKKHHPPRKQALRMT